MRSGHRGSRSRGWATWIKGMATHQGLCSLFSYKTRVLHCYTEEGTGWTHHNHTGVNNTALNILPCFGLKGVMESF